MRIAIFGTGGAGGYFGARLALAGEEVTFIARGEHLRAIREEGLRVLTPEGDLLVRPARAEEEPARVGEVDAVVLGVKTWQVEEAARACAPMLGPETFFVPLQNGVEAHVRVDAALGEGRALVGLCGTISMVEAPGLIRTRSAGAANFVKFGEADGRPSPRAERLRAAFERAGVRAEVPADVHAALWEKFVFVVPLGGVGALTRAPVGVTRALAETRALLEGAAREIYEVGRARGVGLDEGTVARTMDFIDALAPAGTASLQRDIMAGRPTELEAWNGSVVRLGRESGVPTPLNDFIYRSLLPLELRARGRVEFPS